MYKENLFWQKLGLNALIQGSAFWGIQMILGNWVAFRLWWVYLIYLTGVVGFTFMDMKHERMLQKHRANTTRVITFEKK